MGSGGVPRRDLPQGRAFPHGLEGPRTSVLRFEAEVFHERRPGGSVERRREN